MIVLRQPQPHATDAKAAQLYRTMGAYAGRYKTDGDKLIVTPEVASGPALVGTEQTYLIEIKGSLSVEHGSDLQPDLWHASGRDVCRRSR